MTVEQRILAVAIIDREIVRLSGQSKRYRQLPAANEGERELNESGARTCEEHAAALASVLNEIRK